MKKHTKLVDCGSTVFVYESTRSHDKFNFEVNSVGKVTNMKRLFIKNFINNEHVDLTLNFTLLLEINDLPNVQALLEDFTISLAKLFDRPNIKCLAVLELPLESENNHPSIKILTDIDYFEAQMLFDHDPEKDYIEDDYFNEELNEGNGLTKLEERINMLWSNEIFVDSEDTNLLMNPFIRTLTNTLQNPLCTKQTRSVFKSNLKIPKVLRNEKADIHIKKRDLLGFSNQRSKEIYDKKGGFTIVNEYST